MHLKHIFNALCELKSALARSRHNLDTQDTTSVERPKIQYLYLQKVSLFSQLLLEMHSSAFMWTVNHSVCVLWEVMTGQTLCWCKLICLMALTFTHNPISKTWHLGWKSFICPHLWTLCVLPLCDLVQFTEATRSPFTTKVKPVLK